MKLNEVSEFEMTIKSSDEKLKLKYSVAKWWSGTPGKDQKEIAKLAIKFLEQYI